MQNPTAHIPPKGQKVLPKPRKVIRSPNEVKFLETSYAV
jgi:hypothetical protein